MRRGIIVTTVLTTILAGSLCFAGNGSMVKKSMSLKEGWNLVGSVVNNADMETISNQNCVNSMWKWNNQENLWEIYSPNEEIQEMIGKYNLKKFSKVNEGEGFWVNAKEDCQIDLLGEPPSVNDTDLTTSSVDTTFATSVDVLDEASENNENIAPAFAKFFQNSESVSFEGIVKEIPEIGSKSMNGFIFETSEGEDIVLYGLGPVKLWNNSAIDRPIEGDSLSIEAFKISLEDGSYKYVIKKVTDVDGKSLTLRDDSTGLPVWAKGALGKKEEMCGQKKQYKWGKNKK